MLTGKRALITGGARGIGAGIARVMASQGARVAILDLDGVEAEKTAASLPTPGMALVCDVAVESAVDAAVLKVVERFGGLDIVVNNAGVGRGPVDQNSPRQTSATVMSAAVWDEYLSQNLKTTFLTTKATLPHLKARGGGAIVNIASIAALVGVARAPGLRRGEGRRGVVDEEPRAGVRAARHPRERDLPGLPVDARVGGAGAADEGRTEPAYAELEPREIFDDVVKRRVPLGREQTPEDIGQLAAFLASDAARNITGQWIAVDGGITLRQQT